VKLKKLRFFWIWFVLLALILWGDSYIKKKGWLYFSTKNDSIIGHIFKYKNDVKRKYHGDFSWVDVNHGSNVNFKDTIFVGPKSSANLKLTNKSSVNIEPNSLVVLDRSITSENGVITESIELELLIGKMKIESKEQQAKNNKTIKVKVGDATTAELSALDKNSITVAKSDTKSIVMLNEGSVDVLNSEKGFISLDQNKSYVEIGFDKNGSTTDFKKGNSLLFAADDYDIFKFHDDLQKKKTDIFTQIPKRDIKYEIVKILQKAGFQPEKLPEFVESYPTRIPASLYNNKTTKKLSKKDKEFLYWLRFGMAIVAQGFNSTRFAKKIDGNQFGLHAAIGAEYKNFIHSIEAYSSVFDLTDSLEVSPLRLKFDVGYKFNLLSSKAHKLSVSPLVGYDFYFNDVTSNTLSGFFMKHVHGPTLGAKLDYTFKKAFDISAKGYTTLLDKGFHHYIEANATYWASENLGVGGLAWYDFSKIPYQSGDFKENSINFETFLKYRF